jgi:hypothetical protein
MAHILLQELWSGQLLLLQGEPWWRVCLCPLSSPPSLQVNHVSKSFQVLVTLSHHSFSTRRIQLAVGSCGYSVLSCVSWYTREDTGTMSWVESLRLLSARYTAEDLSIIITLFLNVVVGCSRKPEPSGSVLCLQSGVDSNCWQIDLSCASHGKT